MVVPAAKFLPVKFYKHKQLTNMYIKLKVTSS